MARHIKSGDTVIVISYAQYEPGDLDDYEARVVHVDTENRVIAIDAQVATLMS